MRHLFPIDILCLAFLSFFLCIAMPAYADGNGCDNLDQNPAWTSKFQQLNLAFKSEDWNKALKIARDLEDICEFSPILNYTIARIHKNKKDDEKYLFYLQKATQNTERFSVDKNLLDQMWAEKYVIAHPEASPESLHANQIEIESLKNEIESLKIANADKSEEMRVYKSVMWAGTGIGIGGLAFMGIGIALALLYEPAKIYSGHGSAPDKFKECYQHSLGWAMVGIGGSMTVIGATLAGIYGYKYKHFFDNEHLSIQITPMHAAFLFQF